MPADVPIIGAGSPALADHQMVQAMVADAHIDLYAAWLMLRPFRIYDGASEVRRASIARRAFHQQLRA